MKRPYHYDPNNFKETIEEAGLSLEDFTDCGNVDCKVTHLKIRENWCFWYTDTEGDRAVAIFCSLNCLFDCIEPTTEVQ